MQASISRTTTRYPGGYVTYPDGSKGGDARIQQSACFGNPNGTRLHLLRGRSARAAWSSLTVILTVGRFSIETRVRS
jgi:hypothetical protein